MAFFKRNKDKPSKAESADAASSGSESRATGDTTDPASSSPQQVGIVSGVLSTGYSRDSGESTPFSDVVARRFGPATASDAPADDPKVPPTEAGTETPTEAVGQARREGQRDAKTFDLSIESAVETAADSATDAKLEKPEYLRAVEPLLSDPLYTLQSNLDGEPELEVDPMAHIGSATTITGNIVAEEDLEIHGTVEGSVRLAEHRLTIGEEGLVKASVEAHSVLVLGKITGDVVATDLVEIKPGGVIGGDVKAPRVIMHDGAIVVGGLDMSAALPRSPDSVSEKTSQSPVSLERPKLKKVEAPEVTAEEELGL